MLCKLINTMQKAQPPVQNGGCVFFLPAKKYCLMNAYDDIDFLLSNIDKIEAWEKNNL